MLCLESHDNYLKIKWASNLRLNANSKGWQLIHGLRGKKILALFSELF